MKLAFYPESRNSLEQGTPPASLAMAKAKFYFPKLTSVPILWNHSVRT